MAGTISISRKELRQNSGEGRLLNLLEAKIKQAEMTMREKLNNDLLAGTVSSATFVQDTAEDGSYGLNPLGYFLRKEKATDPTTNDVGNIPGDTYSWWRHRTGVLGSNAASVSNEDFSLNCTTYAALQVGLKRMYNYCSRGSGGSPDLCVGDQVTYETYENAMDSKVRYMNTKMADMGKFFFNAHVKPCELRETPNVKTRAILSQASNEEGATTIQQWSTHKCVEAQGAHLDLSGDIVSSAWKHAAASAV